MKFLVVWFAIVSTLILWSMQASVYAADASDSGRTKQQRCEVMKTALQKKAGKLLDKAMLYKAVFDEAAEKNEKQIDPTVLKTKQTIVTTSLASTERDIAAISCPTSQLRTTMKKVEQDLRDVNRALSDYRKTLKGLTGKPDSVLGAQTRQSVATCTTSQVAVKKQAMTVLTDNAQALAMKYAKRAKVSGALPSAIVQSRRLAFESALQNARQDIVKLTCVNGSMQSGMQTFKSDMQQTLIALKSYRQSLLDTTLDSQQSELEEAVIQLPLIN